MSESAVYRPHPEEPARATLRDVVQGGVWAALNAQRFEIVSRGDFVPGILCLPDSAPKTPAPLLLLPHGTSEGTAHGTSNEIDSAAIAAASAWVDAGLALATIDLPLCGARSSPKLSERLLSGVEQLSNGSELDPQTRVLVEEFARQTTSDLTRTLDALIALPSIDGGRVGFMGFDLGALAGSYLLAHDPRPRVAVLALGRGGRGPSDLDPATYLAKISGTSILIVAAEGDEASDSEASSALFEAATQPKEFLSLRDSSDAFTSDVIATIGRFLFKELSL